MTAPTRDDHAVVLTYGKAKAGKSVSAGYSFPRALWFARPDQVESVRSVCGYSPTLAPPVRYLSDITRLIEQLGRSKNRDQYDAIVVDDTSVVADETMSYHEERAGSNKFGAFGKMKSDVFDLRGAARDCGLHVLFNFHQRDPDVKEGKLYRGGPALPSKNLTDMIPVIAPTVLRAAVDPARVPWGGIYVCDPTDVNYVSGDRFNMAPKQGPMNEAELLRSAGFRIRRLPGMDWQDTAADQVAEQILKGALVLDVARRFRDKAESLRLDNRMALWALRDGIDRAEFARHREAGAWSFLT